MNSIKDVTFARAIETGDGIELRVEAGDDSPVYVGLESFQDDLVDVHDDYINNARLYF